MRVSQKSSRKGRGRVWIRFAIAASAAVGAAFVVFPLLFGQTAASSARPNIIFIQTDDQDFRMLDAVRPDTGEFAFPNIRSIAAEGVNFNNTFLPHGLCCPSRATLYSGQYDHNHGVITNEAPFGGYGKLDHTNTLPVWLKAAGYYTMHLGKYMNGYAQAVSEGAGPLVPPGWDEWFTPLDASQYFNFEIVTENGAVIPFGNSPGDYQTDVIARRAARFIAGRSYGGKPFFMGVDFFAPHVGENGQPGSGTEAVPAPRHAGIFNAYEPVFPPSFNESDVSDKPQNIASLPSFSQAGINSIKKSIRLRLEALLAVDEGVGRIIETLDRMHLLSNTVIIFVSDNGVQQGEHRISSGKNKPYTESIHVPLLIRGPGIPHGMVIPKLVSNIDYAPTIVDLADATPGRIMDGRSLLPLIANPSLPWRHGILLENLRINASDGFFLGLVTNDKVYVEYEYNGKAADSLPDDVELYATMPDSCRPVGDPYQLESQHTNPCYEHLLEEFHSIVQSQKVCSGESCWW